MLDTEYIYSQVWLLFFVACLFGPMLPILFMYGFIGMLVNDVTARLRIAYSVRITPKYDGS